MSTTVAEMLVETLHRIGVRDEEGNALVAPGHIKLTGKLEICFTVKLR
ncbi:hypothetical protein [Herbaspirillum sp. meg3]|nr:hypothetical protein [Herbaspirillum sp. meg3]